MLPSPIHPRPSPPPPRSTARGCPERWDTHGPPLPHPAPAPPLWSRGGVVGVRTRPVPGPAPSADRERPSPQNPGEPRGSRKAPQNLGVRERPPQIPWGPCGPGEPPTFREGPVVRESPSSSGRILWSEPPPPHPGVPIRAGEGDSAPLGYFRRGLKLPKATKSCSGVSASTRVFRPHSGISGSTRDRGSAGGARLFPRLSAESTEGSFG